MFDFSPQGLLSAALRVILLLLSLSVHEFAHAWAAWKLGDDTAARQGRLTLNPFAHADPFGTYLLPFLGLPIGWAKPVPVDPSRFRRDVNMRTGFAITAAAGPLANVLLALVSAVVLGGLVRFAPDLVPLGSPVRVLLFMLIGSNVGLAIFNLLPVPPLDGSRIVDRFIPYRLRPTWEQLTAMSPILLVVVLVAINRFGLLSGPMDYLYDVLLSVSRFIARA